jgi:hypothetical protein
MRELRRTGIHPVREALVVTVRRTAEGGFEAAEEHEGGGIPNLPGEETTQPEIVRD